LNSAQFLSAAIPLFSELAFVMEKARFENELVGNGGDLRGSVRAIAGCSKVDGVFDLVKEHFNGLVGVIVGLHLFVVGEEAGGTDICIGGIKMIQKISGATVLIFDIFGAKREEEHVLDGADDLLFESLVGGIVLAEERGGFVVRAIELGDLGVGTVARDGDAFARICWADKRCCRQCVVDVGGKHEL
jgi:hypothetical protein